MLMVVAAAINFLSDFRSFLPMQKYHSSRVLTLVYQPFAFGVLAILTYKEAKINTRRRNLFGYILFFISSLLVLVVRTVCLYNTYIF